MSESRFFKTVAYTPQGIEKHSYRFHEDLQQNRYSPFGSMDGFYRWNLRVDSADTATLVAMPTSRYASNRYHSMQTPDGQIVSQRGRREYRVGYSTLIPHEYENITLLESTPKRGRRVTPEKEYKVMGFVEIALFDDAPIFSIPHKRRGQVSEAQLLRFLDLAAKYKDTL